MQRVGHALLDPGCHIAGDISEEFSRVPLEFLSHVLAIKLDLGVEGRQLLEELGHELAGMVCVIGHCRDRFKDYSVRELADGGLEGEGPGRG